jgi:hypothetical protein
MNDKPVASREYPRDARPYSTPATRPLAVFAFDPKLGRSLGNHMILRAQYEERARGHGCYDPADLHAGQVLVRLRDPALSAR